MMQCIACQPQRALFAITEENLRPLSDQTSGKVFKLAGRNIGEQVAIMIGCKCHHCKVVAIDPTASFTRQKPHHFGNIVHAAQPPLCSHHSFGCLSRSAVRRIWSRGWTNNHPIGSQFVLHVVVLWPSFESENLMQPSMLRRADSEDNLHAMQASFYYNISYSQPTIVSILTC